MRLILLQQLLVNRERENDQTAMGSDQDCLPQKSRRGAAAALLMLAAIGMVAPVGGSSDCFPAADRKFPLVLSDGWPGTEDVIFSAVDGNADFLIVGGDIAATSQFVTASRSTRAFVGKVDLSLTTFAWFRAVDLNSADAPADSTEHKLRAVSINSESSDRFVYLVDVIGNGVISPYLQILFTDDGSPISEIRWVALSKNSQYSVSPKGLLMQGNNKVYVAWNFMSGGVQLSGDGQTYVGHGMISQFNDKQLTPTLLKLESHFGYSSTLAYKVFETSSLLFVGGSCDTGRTTSMSETAKWVPCIFSFDVRNTNIGFIDSVNIRIGGTEYSDERSHPTVCTLKVSNSQSFVIGAVEGLDRSDGTHMFNFVISITEDGKFNHQDSSNYVAVFSGLTASLGSTTKILDSFDIASNNDTPMIYTLFFAPDHAGGSLYIQSYDQSSSRKLIHLASNLELISSGIITGASSTVDGGGNTVYESYAAGKSRQFILTDGSSAPVQQTSASMGFVTSSDRSKICNDQQADTFEIQVTEAQGTNFDNNAAYAFASINAESSLLVNSANIDLVLSSMADASWCSSFPSSVTAWIEPVQAEYYCASSTDGNAGSSVDITIPGALKPACSLNREFLMWAEPLDPSYNPDDFQVYLSPNSDQGNNLAMFTVGQATADYNADFQVHFTYPNGQDSSYTVKVVNDEHAATCVHPTLTVPDYLANMYFYQYSGVSADYEIPEFNVTDGCPVTYISRAQATSDTSTQQYLTILERGVNVAYDASAPADQLGTIVVDVYASAGCSLQSKSFNLIVQEQGQDCGSDTLSLDLGDKATLTQQIHRAEVTLTWEDAAVESAFSLLPSDCGGLTWLKVKSDGSGALYEEPSFITSEDLASQTKQITFKSTDYAQRGNHGFRLQACFNDAPTVCAEQLITLTLEDYCSTNMVVSLVDGFAIEDVDYYVQQPDVTVSLAGAFTVDPPECVFLTQFSDGDLGDGVISFKPETETMRVYARAPYQAMQRNSNDAFVTPRVVPISYFPKAESGTSLQSDALLTFTVNAHNQCMDSAADPSVEVISEENKYVAVAVGAGAFTIDFNTDGLIIYADEYDRCQDLDIVEVIQASGGALDTTVYKTDDEKTRLEVDPSGSGATMGVHQLLHRYRIFRYGQAYTDINTAFEVEFIGCVNQAPSQVSSSDFPIVAKYSGASTQSIILPAFTAHEACGPIVLTLNADALDAYASLSSSDGLQSQTVTIDVPACPVQAEDVPVSLNVEHDYASTHIDLAVISVNEVCEPTVQFIVAKPFLDLSGMETEYALQVGEEWSVVLPEPSHDDDSGDHDLTLALTVDRAMSFLVFNSEMRSLQIHPNTTAEIDAGAYTLSLTVSDENGVSSPTYSIKVEITVPEVEEEVAEIDQAMLDAILSQLMKKRMEEQVQSAAFDKANLQDKYKDVEIEPLQVHIKRVSDTGRVTITFTNNMIVPEAVFTGGRLLQDDQDETTPFEIIKSQGMIRVALVDHSGLSTASKSFEWVLVSYELRQMQMQIDFDHPLTVSSSQEHDEISIEFVDTRLFYDFAGQELERGTLVFKRIPPQFQSAKEAQVFEDIKQVFTQYEFGDFTSNIVLNTIVAAMLSSLWSMVPTQQIIVMIPLFSIQMPANALVVYSLLLKIAAFEMIPAEFMFSSMVERLSQEEKSQELRQQFEALGFDTVWMLPNMASIFVILGVYACGFALLPLLRLLELCFKCFCITNSRESLNKYLMWGWPLDFIKESYIVIDICCMINLLQVDSSSWDAMLNYRVSVGVMCVLAAYPAIQQLSLYRFKSQLHLPGFQTRFYNAYKDLDHRDSKYFMYPLLYFYRRLLILVIVISLPTILIFQYFTLTMTTIATIIQVGWERPFARPLMNNVEMLSETVVIVIMYHVFCFTDFVPDPTTRHVIGYSLIAWTVFHFLLHYSIIGSAWLRRTYASQRRKYIVRRAKRSWTPTRFKFALPRRVAEERAYLERREKKYKRQLKERALQAKNCNKRVKFAIDEPSGGGSWPRKGEHHKREIPARPLRCNFLDGKQDDPMAREVDSILVERQLLQPDRRLLVEDSLHDVPIKDTIYARHGESGATRKINDFSHAVSFSSPADLPPLLLSKEAIDFNLEVMQGVVLQVRKPTLQCVNPRQPEPKQRTRVLQIEEEKVNRRKDQALY